MLYASLQEFDLLRSGTWTESLEHVGASSSPCDGCGRRTADTQASRANTRYEVRKSHADAVGSEVSHRDRASGAGSLSRDLDIEVRGSRVACQPCHPSSIKPLVKPVQSHIAWTGKANYVPVAAEKVVEISMPTLKSHA